MFLDLGVNKHLFTMVLCEVVVNSILVHLSSNSKHPSSTVNTLHWNPVVMSLSMQWR